VLSPPLPKPDFVFTDTSGEAFDFQQETEGYVTLLYFGYTHCPDICPSHMADVAAVIDRNPDWVEHVKVVFVSVDPARDTPERLRT
jgi:protein SCO1/2